MTEIYLKIVFKMRMSQPFTLTRSYSLHPQGRSNEENTHRDNITLQRKLHIIDLKFGIF